MFNHVWTVGGGNGTSLNENELLWNNGNHNVLTSEVKKKKNQKNFQGQRQYVQYFFRASVWMNQSQAARGFLIFQFTEDFIVFGAGIENIFKVSNTIWLENSFPLSPGKTSQEGGEDTGSLLEELC